MSCKDVGDLCRKARRQGWSVTWTGSGHLRFQPPVGKFIIASATPNGGRFGLCKLRHALRRAGLRV